LLAAVARSEQTCPRVDWSRRDLDEIRKAIESKNRLEGNVDSSVLFARPRRKFAIVTWAKIIPRCNGHILKPRTTALRTRLSKKRLALIEKSVSAP